MKEGYINSESISECIVEQIEDVLVPQIMEDITELEKLNGLSEGEAMKGAGVKIEGIAISKRLTHPPVEVTSQF